MPYIVLVVILVTAALVLGACRRDSAPDRPEPNPIAAPADVPAQPGSKRDIAARLKVLADAPPPTELSMGAMCYEMIGPPDRAEYVCPTCGEKTLYARGGERDAAPQQVDLEIPACRRHLAGVKDVSATLDESAFCARCSPDAKLPRLSLVIRYPDGTEHCTVGVRSEDILLLAEFTSGALKHDRGMAGEAALKDSLERIQELLGVRRAE